MGNASHFNYLEVGIVSLALLGLLILVGKILAALLLELLNFLRDKSKTVFQKNK